MGAFGLETWRGWNLFGGGEGGGGGMVASGVGGTVVAEVQWLGGGGIGWMDVLIVIVCDCEIFVNALVLLLLQAIVTQILMFD